jgi:DNA-directed RNA polymerase specialized sigma24 family protein
VSELSTLTDAELVERSRCAPDGDVRAFEALVSRHQDAILTNCRCITRSVDDAPGLVQEVFVKAFFTDGWNGRTVAR